MMQLHWALFNGTSGYILKPKQMRNFPAPSTDPAVGLAEMPEVAQWPPPREKLCRATIKILSLHNLPKVKM